MEVRQATVDDATGIKEVADASLRASYDFIDGETITEAVEQWYGEGFDEYIVEEEELFLVAAMGPDEESTDVVGFSECCLIDGEAPVGEIRWLHVHPDHRGRGIAAELFEHTEDVLRSHGAKRFRGLVLEENEEGNDFYEYMGFDMAGSRSVDIGDERHVENVYETLGGPEDVEPAYATEVTTTEDGKTVYVARDEPNRGTLAPFYPVYSDEDREQRYGWFCGNCESLEVAMDSMDRIECTKCTNSKKPTRWDAAYL